MTDRLEIIIDTLANLAALEATGAQLGELETKTQGADAATQGTVQSLGLLTSTLGAFGVALSAAAVVNFTEQLVNMGAAALRAQAGLDTLTQGRSQEWASAMQTSVHGLIDDEDAMAVATDLMSRGLAKTKEQAAEFERVAGTLGEQFRNMPIKQATEEFANMLAGGRIMQLREFGISITEVKARTAELMASTQGLTQAEAQNQAIMEIATAKANQFAGVLDDQASRLEKLKIRWTDFWESVGKGVDKDIVTPLMDQMDAVDALDKKREQDYLAVAKQSDSYDVFIEKVKTLEGVTGLQAGQITTLEKVWGDYTAAVLAAANAQTDSLETMRQNRDRGLAPTTEALAAQKKALEEVKKAAEELNKATQAEAGMQLSLEMSIDSLLPKLHTQAGVFQIGAQAIKGMGLSEMDTLNLTEQLGLATGGLTSKQINQAAALREVNDALAKGKITIPDYTKLLGDMGAGLDPVKVKAEMVADAVNKLGPKGSENMKMVTAALADLDSQASSAIDTQSKLNQGLDAAGKKDTVLKMNKQQIDSANSAVDDLAHKLVALPKDVTVKVNYVITQSGNVPAGVAP